MSKADSKLEVPRTMALRIALGLVATLALAASGVGIAMSVKINWEFARTLGRNADAGWYMALTLAAVEGARIMMPFVAKGMKLANLRYKWAYAAFVVFTAVSIVSAFGYFALNRADAAAQRGMQVSLSKGFKADLDSVTRSLERNASVRATEEVEAEIKGLPRGDPKRPALEQEKAAAIQRDKDRKRLTEISQAHTWNVEIPSSKDEQTGLIADTVLSLPWVSLTRNDETKANLERIITFIIIATSILALELLVGVTPFAAIMVLVWACRRPEDDHLRDRPPKGGDGAPNSDGTSNEIEHRNSAGNRRSKSLSGTPPLDALADLRRLLESGQKVPSQKWLAERWGWSETSVHRYVNEWADEDHLVVRRFGRGKCNAISLPRAVVPSHNGNGMAKAAIA